MTDRLRKTTVRRIHILNQRLVEELPGLQEFLAHLAQTILQPILQGERIGYTVRLGGGDASLSLWKPSLLHQPRMHSFYRKGLTRGVLEAAALMALG